MSTVEPAEKERQEILDLIAQMKGIHKKNRAVVVVLDFLMDVIKNRRTT